VHRLADLFYDGSRERLLTELLSDRRLRPPELQRLRRLLDERLGGTRS
jgi:hypothetical protein